MGEVAVKIAQWLIKSTFFIAVVVALLVIIAFINTYLVIGFNQSILGDIFSLIQMWAPFNISVILIWLTIAGTVYIGYRLSFMAYNLVNSYIGK